MEAVISGGMCLIGMTILQLPYAPMIASVMVIAAFIPLIGAFMGTVIGAFMIMMVNPIQAVWFVIMILISQQIEGNLIYPRVVGFSIGLPPMWVLASVTIGGGLFGMLGMILAVPTASVFYTLMGRSVKRKLTKKGIDPAEVVSTVYTETRTRRFKKEKSDSEQK